MWSFYFDNFISVSNKMWDWIDFSLFNVSFRPTSSSDTHFCPQPINAKKHYGLRRLDGIMVCPFMPVSSAGYLCMPLSHHQLQAVPSDTQHMRTEDEVARRPKAWAIWGKNKVGCLVTDLDTMKRKMGLKSHPEPLVGYWQRGYLDRTILIGWKINDSARSKSKVNGNQCR